MYHKSMPRLGGRLLSVAWHPNGQSVVTGTAVGTLHAWHIAKSQELMRISIGETQNRKFSEPISRCCILAVCTIRQYVAMGSAFLAWAIVEAKPSYG